MNVYLVMCYAHDENSIVSLHKNKVNAEEAAKLLDQNKTSKYDEFYVDEWELLE